MTGRAWLGASARVLSMSGCATGAVPAPGASAGAGVSEQDDWETLRAQAREVLTRSGPPPSWDPYANHPGLSIDAATIDKSGTAMTVTFTGAPGPASEPCGIDYTAEAVEAPHAVAVVVLGRPHAQGEICPAIGATRSATLTLDTPLGDRKVLEAGQGEAVTVTTR